MLGFVNPQWCPHEHSNCESIPVRCMAFRPVLTLEGCLTVLFMLYMPPHFGYLVSSFCLASGRFDCARWCGRTQNVLTAVSSHIRFQPRRSYAMRGGCRLLLAAAAPQNLCNTNTEIRFRNFENGYGKGNETWWPLRNTRSNDHFVMTNGRQVWLIGRYSRDWPVHRRKPRPALKYPGFWRLCHDRGPGHNLASKAGNCRGNFGRVFGRRCSRNGEWINHKMRLIFRFEKNVKCRRLCT